MGFQTLHGAKLNLLFVSQSLGIRMLISTNTFPLFQAEKSDELLWVCSRIFDDVVVLNKFVKVVWCKNKTVLFIHISHIWFE